MYKLLLNNSNMCKLFFLCILLIILFFIKKVENFSSIHFSTGTFPVEHIDTFKYLNNRSEIKLIKILLVI